MLPNLIKKSFSVNFSFLEDATRIYFQKKISKKFNFGEKKLIFETDFYPIANFISRNWITWGRSDET